MGKVETVACGVAAVVVCGLIVPGAKRVLGGSLSFIGGAVMRALKRGKSEEAKVKTNLPQGKVQEEEDGKMDETTPLESVLSSSSSDVMSWLSGGSSTSDLGEERADFEAFFLNDDEELQEFGTQSFEEEPIVQQEPAVPESGLVVEAFEEKDKVYEEAMVVDETKAGKLNPQESQESVLNMGSMKGHWCSTLMAEVSAESDVDKQEMSGESNVDKQEGSGEQNADTQEVSGESEMVDQETVGPADDKTEKFALPVMAVGFGKETQGTYEKKQQQPLRLEKLGGTVRKGVERMEKKGAGGDVAVCSAGEQNKCYPRKCHESVQSEKKWAGSGGRISQKYQSMYDPTDKHEANYYHVQNLNWQLLLGNGRDAPVEGRPAWRS